MSTVQQQLRDADKILRFANDVIEHHLGGRVLADGFAAGFDLPA